MEQSAAILLSRQARGACATSAWVKNTQAAIHYLQYRKFTLSSSIGLRTWDLIAVLGGDAGLSLRLYVIIKDGDDFLWLRDWIFDQYDLSPERVRFVPILAPTKKDRATAMRTRDRLIIEQCDLLLPISLRPRGTMERWLDHARPTQRLEESFRTAYEIDRQLGAVDYTDCAINPEIDLFGSDFLFHWTRTIDHPWPGETIADYCRAIVSSERYPRTAKATLLRIAKSRTLIASSRHMPGNTPTVSFTSLPPSRTIPLMRWRARYGEMSFEPYAIGIGKVVGLQLGIQPVSYYDAGSRQAVSGTPAWLTQSRGKIADWTGEQEWRCRGDLDLSALHPEKMILICRTPDETAAMEKASGLRTLALFRD